MHFEHIDDEQQDNGSIENSSRQILHSLMGIGAIGLSFDNDNESRVTKIFIFIFFRRKKLLL
jgi:hypothetical protein